MTTPAAHRAHRETLATVGNKLSCMSMVRVKDGEFDVVGDQAKPFACWPGDTTEWSEPQILDFE